MSAELDVDDGTARLSSALDMVSPGADALGLPAPERLRRSADGVPGRADVPPCPDRLRPLPGRHLRPVGGGRTRLCRARARAPRGAAPAHPGRSRGGPRAARPLVRRRGDAPAVTADRIDARHGGRRGREHAGRGRDLPHRRRRGGEAEARIRAMADRLRRDQGRGPGGRGRQAGSQAKAAEADRIVDRAEQTLREARAEAAVRLEEVRAVEQRAVEHADRLRQQALVGGGRRPATRPGTRSSGC